MLKEAEIEQQLGHFTGTEKYWSYNLLGCGLKLTDGVHWLAEKAGCFWLLDIIVSTMTIEKVRKEPFRSVKLTLSEAKDDTSWKVVIDDGNENVLYEQEGELTDFPLSGGIQLYWIDDVVLLTSEY
ncbi:MAG TPA: hypothetical protein DHN29_01365 [Cytophagales bacterium]|nr:hypothetical protein [Cytophagales bacterium]|tara:strand:+ start:137 stop:514 length:378 start_codon:yes stop_codon:yes gene_type:complete